MNRLTIFWGDKNQKHFFWHFEGTAKDSVAVPQLESREILKDDLVVIADMAATSKVELVLSANDVHFAQVSVPGKAHRHMRKAIPFMLEEQVAESVDELFVAIGARNNEKIAVRAIARRYLQSLVDKFKSAEIKLDKVIVDLDCVLRDEEGVLAILDNEKVLIAEHGKENWQCDVDDFSWLIQKQINAEETEDALPVAIPLSIVSENEDNAKMFEQNLPVGRFAPVVEPCDDIHAYIAQQSIDAINLLQAEFEPKSENSAIKQMLTKVAIVFAFVLGVHLTYQGSQWFTLAAKADVLEQEKEALWKQAFPGRKMPKSANRQIRSAVKSLSAGSGNSAFLTMLDEVTALISNANDLYPTNVSYDVARNEMRIDLIGKEYATLNVYRDSLVKSGFQVDMNSATQRGEGYSSRFIIKK